MIVGLLGDIHGRISLALKGLIAWQAHAGKQFDLQRAQDVPPGLGWRMAHEGANNAT